MGFRAIKVSEDIKRGKKGFLSRAEILDMKVNLGDARKNLPKELFNDVYEYYKAVHKDTERKEYDFDTMTDEIVKITTSLNVLAPYELMDGIRSINRSEEECRAIINEWNRTFEEDAYASYVAANGPLNDDAILEDDCSDDSNMDVLDDVSEHVVIPINMMKHTIEDDDFFKTASKEEVQLAVDYYMSNGIDDTECKLKDVDFDKIVYLMSAVKKKIAINRKLKDFYEDLYCHAILVSNSLKNEDEVIEDDVMIYYATAVCDYLSRITGLRVTDGFLTWLDLFMIQQGSDWEYRGAWLENLVVSSKFNTSISQDETFIEINDIDENDVEEYYKLLFVTHAYSRSGSAKYSDYKARYDSEPFGAMERTFLDGFNTREDAEYNIKLMYDCLNEYLDDGTYEAYLTEENFSLDNPEEDTDFNGLDSNKKVVADVTKEKPQGKATSISKKIIVALISFVIVGLAVVFGIMYDGNSNPELTPYEGRYQFDYCEMYDMNGNDLGVADDMNPDGKTEIELFDNGDAYVDIADESASGTWDIENDEYKDFTAMSLSLEGDESASMVKSVSVYKDGSGLFWGFDYEDVVYQFNYKRIDW